MKRLNNFLDKAPLWQVYIFGWFFTGAFTTFLFYVPVPLIAANTAKTIFSAEVCLKIGAMSGLLFGLMFMLIISMMRKSTIFWSYAKEVEKFINEANSKDALELILENQFEYLRKKCQGGPQIPELNRLYTIMKTKYKYL
jgi:hypothetical protein